MSRLVKNNIKSHIRYDFEMDTTFFVDCNRLLHKKKLNANKQ